MKKKKLVRFSDVALAFLTRSLGVRWTAWALTFTCIALGISGRVCRAEPWGTAFTYQGHLTEAGQPANGTFNLEFTLYSTADTSAPVGDSILEKVFITNGLFTVKLDFSTNIITSEKRWLGICLERTGEFEAAGMPPRVCLGPPVELTALPLALVAAYYIPELMVQPNFGATGRYATIAGGSINSAGADYSTIGGGHGNAIFTNSDCATIAGGCDNRIQTNAPDASIGGGLANQIQTGADRSTIGGGGQNLIQPNAAGAAISGGDRNTIQTNATVSAIGGGRFNTIGVDARSSSIAGGDTQTIEAGASRASIGGGFQNVIGRQAQGSTVAGGEWNRIEFNTAQGAIGGGSNNLIFDHSSAAAIGGGRDNLIRDQAPGSIISGGQMNLIEYLARNSAIGGGLNNMIQVGSEGAAVSGGGGNRIDPNASFATIGGGLSNQVAAYAGQATVGGGANNAVLARCSTIAGGTSNLIASDSIYGTISGGALNQIEPAANGVAIGGGILNAARASGVTIAGGYVNKANADGSTIGGGANNQIERGADGSIIGGGDGNSINSSIAGTIPGGEENLVGGSYSLAAGRRAAALHMGCFVWGDSTGALTTSTKSNQFVVRASGGVRFISNEDGTAGVMLPAGSGSWSSLSDRGAKTNCVPVDGRVVLEKLARMPIQTWNYRSQEAGIRHIGPMAQDFHSTFQVGEDAQHISTVDADGVALAAIQGLSQKLDAQQTQLAAGAQQIEQLQQTVSELKLLIGHLRGRGTE